MFQTRSTGNRLFNIWNSDMIERLLVVLIAAVIILLILLILSYFKIDRDGKKISFLSDENRRLKILLSDRVERDR